MHLEVVERGVLDDREGLEKSGEQSDHVGAHVRSRRLTELKQLLGAKPTHLWERERAPW